MQAISTINLPASTLQPSEELSLAVRSGPPVPKGMGLALLRMMAEAQAAKPNQVLPKGTPDMYLVQWEEMALKYGLPMFRDGLMAALRSSRFFPDPLDIAEHCAALRKAELERAKTARREAQEREWRETWERELAEDLAVGVPRDPHTGAHLESEAWLKAQAEKAPKRPSLTGWTAEELRAAADALDAGREVAPPAISRDAYEIAAEMRRRLGVTRAFDEGGGGSVATQEEVTA